MIRNMSKDDRIIRTVIGLGIISLVFIGPATLWGWVGIIPLITVAIGFCPLYTKLGFDTKEAAGENIATNEVLNAEDVAETPEVTETPKVAETVQVSEKSEVSDISQNQKAEAT